MDGLTWGRERRGNIENDFSWGSGWGVLPLDEAVHQDGNTPGEEQVGGDAPKFSFAYGLEFYNTNLRCNEPTQNAELGKKGVQGRLKIYI